MIVNDCWFDLAIILARLGEYPSWTSKKCIIVPNPYFRNDRDYVPKITNLLFGADPYHGTCKGSDSTTSLQHFHQKQSRKDAAKTPVS